MDKKLIVARYDDEDRLHLKMVGPIPESVIDEIFLPRNPYTRCAVEQGSGYGEVSLLVESEDSCLGLVKELNVELKEKSYKDYNLEYRGPVAVPPEKLSILKIPYDLYRLVIDTMIAESKGEINPEDLVKLDYQKVLEEINKKSLEKLTK